MKTVSLQNSAFFAVRHLGISHKEGNVQPSFADRSEMLSACPFAQFDENVRMAGPVVAEQLAQKSFG